MRPDVAVRYGKWKKSIVKSHWKDMGAGKSYA